jgi:DNA-binding transcriptional regulator YdaS (Cro superfamily)
MKEALDLAKQKAGGASGLARALGGISPQAVSQWDRVPAERVIQVEKVTGIARHQLRPDIYPPENISQSPEPSPFTEAAQ